MTVVNLTCQKTPNPATLNAEILGSIKETSSMQQRRGGPERAGASLPLGAVGDPTPNIKTNSKLLIMTSNGFRTNLTLSCCY
jgi:hypothetical protein